MVLAVDAPQTLFRAPLTLGVGVQGWNIAKNLSAIKIYSYAKFTKIGLTVWISIISEHNIYWLYILDKQQIEEKAPSVAWLGWLRQTLS